MATQWTSNAAKTTGALTYRNPATAYSSSTVKYSGINVALSEDGKLSDIWTRTNSNVARWSSNTALLGIVTYSTSALTYNDVPTVYSGVNVLLAYDAKLAATWSKQRNLVTYGSHPLLDGSVMYGGTDFVAGILWSSNAAASANQYAYDSTKLYDSGADTYDGIVVGQSSSGTQVPTRWT